MSVLATTAWSSTDWCFCKTSSTLVLMQSLSPSKAAGDLMADELQLASPAPCAAFIIRNKGQERWHKKLKVCLSVIVTQTVKCHYLKLFPELGFVWKEGGGDKWRSTNFLNLSPLQRGPNTAVISPLTCLSSCRSSQCFSGHL